MVWQLYSYVPLGLHIIIVLLTICTQVISSKSEEALDNLKWKPAMIEKIKELHTYSMWKLIKLPEGKKTLGGRYSVKYKAYGSMERYEPRLVAKN